MTYNGSVTSNMDGFSSFSGTFCAVLVYYLEVGDVGSETIVGNAVFINCKGVMPIVLSYSIVQTSIDSPICFSCDGCLFLGYIMIHLMVLAPLKMTYTLVC